MRHCIPSDVDYAPRGLSPTYPYKIQYPALAFIHSGRSFHTISNLTFLKPVHLSRHKEQFQSVVLHPQVKMAVIWGLDLKEIQWWKLNGSYMFNQVYHLRRTKMIVYQIAMILCVVSESVGTVALSGIAPTPFPPYPPVPIPS